MPITAVRQTPVPEPPAHPSGEAERNSEYLCPARVCTGPADYFGMLRRQAGSVPFAASISIGRFAAKWTLNSQESRFPGIPLFMPDLDRSSRGAWMTVSKRVENGKTTIWAIHTNDGSDDYAEHGQRMYQPGNPNRAKRPRVLNRGRRLGATPKTRPCSAFIAVSTLSLRANWGQTGALAPASNPNMTASSFLSTGLAIIGKKNSRNDDRRRNRSA